MGDQHKYATVGDAIRREIETRQFKPGQRLPSDSELARRFGTSRLTVLRALRSLESEGLVRRRAGSGTFVSGSSTQARTFTFGILMPDLGDGEVFEPISQAIAQVAESTHQQILWGNTSSLGRGKEEYALELCRYFIARRVDGVFFAPVELSEHQTEVNERVVEELHSSGIQIVLIDRCIRPYPERCPYDLAGIDNHRAGYRMTRYLLDRGSKRLAFAYRHGSAPTVLARLAGWREALHQKRLTEQYEFTLDAGDIRREQLKRFVGSNKIDAFVCANDLTAARLMQALLASGIRVPEDVRMVGVNDVKYARFLPVPLTTLRQPCQEIGAAAVSAMLEPVGSYRGPARDILLDCELVVRESCGAALA